jgi:pimeloyl-ACP methyl ester carboxylesterase
MIPGAGHMVQLEASDAVNAILLDYLRDIRERA